MKAKFQLSDDAGSWEAPTVPRKHCSAGCARLSSWKSQDRPQSNMSVDIVQSLYLGIGGRGPVGGGPGDGGYCDDLMREGILMDWKGLWRGVVAARVLTKLDTTCSVCVKDKSEFLLIVWSGVGDVRVQYIIYIKAWKGGGKDKRSKSGI